MKCPLLSLRPIDRSYVEGHGPHDCLQEECAWWDEKIQLCSVRSWCERIRNVEMRVEAIDEKLTERGK